MAEAASQTGQSESMEDILQSIKRIIEDDASTEARAPSDGQEDVLDLTQMVKEDNSVTTLPPVPTPKAPSGTTPQDVMESIDVIFANNKPADISEEKPAAPPAEVISFAVPATAPAHKPVTLEEGLMSDDTAQAAAAALKPIVDSAQKDYSVPHIPSPALRDGNTVENLILEALRPMLKGWLDEHLPTIVQKIVEKEVKRIVTFHHDNS